MLLDLTSSLTPTFATGPAGAVVTLASTNLLAVLYLVSAVMFILGLKMLSRVESARRGNLVSALGMLLACGVTFFHLTGAEAISLVWILIAMLLGGAVGLVLALRVPMTGMPQMVALLNGFGGIASLLVASGDFFHGVDPVWWSLLATGLAVLIGGVTFTGSLIAFGKLQGLKLTPSAPVQFPGQKIAIALLLALALLLSVLLIPAPWFWLRTAMILLVAGMALALGVMLVVGIGGADMPVVISLLNSYSGLAAAMAGFALDNHALIITGALVGASGVILTSIMCKAMNRSLLNVLFGGVGAAVAGGQGGPTGTAKAYTAEDVAIQLDAASRVMIVPGYGMAVAQAQHAVKELADLLEARGVTVRYAIHPVAGRMPGHMNVLLAEASVSYESLLDLEGANPEFEQTDVALIIGANDVTNPAARTDTASPIYGMPILDVDKARSVVVIKRSLSPGFAGIQNELYFAPNCGMLFGDGKAMATALVHEVKQVG